MPHQQGKLHPPFDFKSSRVNFELLRDPWVGKGGTVIGNSVGITCFVGVTEGMGVLVAVLSSVTVGVISDDRGATQAVRRVILRMRINV
jgi:hypothetical protein